MKHIPNKSTLFEEIEPAEGKKWKIAGDAEESLSPP